jgi:hypothetical protein
MIRMNPSKFGNWPSGPASIIRKRQLHLLRVSNLFGFGGYSAGGHKILNSLRFRASNSAFLWRTFGSGGDRKTWTMNVRVKRGRLGASQAIMSVYDASDDNSAALIQFNDSNQLVVAAWFTTWRITNRVFRDVSAFYDICISMDTTQATANDRVRIEVNGVQETSFATLNNPSLNADLGINRATRHEIGRDDYDGSRNFDGLMAEFTFVGGQRLSSSSFGQIDPVSSEWVSKRYTGTYGTNGCFLPFTNAGSTTTIGWDYADPARGGTPNDWASPGVSVTAGVTFDQMADTPTNNFCTWNPLKQSGSGVAALSSANLRVSGGGSGESSIGTFGMTTGKWYWEYTVESITQSPDIGFSQLPGNNAWPAGMKHYVYRSDGNKRSEIGGLTAYGAGYTNGDVIGNALDCDAGTITFYKNGTSQGVAFSGIASSEYPFFPFAGVNNSSGNSNFGQRPFANTPPSGFLAICTQNLPTPTILRGDNGFDVVARAGSNSAVNVTNRRFAPNIVWTKSRNTADWHNIADTVRGPSRNLFSNNTNAEDTLGNVTAFNSDGYTLGGGFGRTNASGQNFVDWMWRIGPAYGCDVVSYTGNGANRTIAHGLNAVPHMMIFKYRSGGAGSYSWATYHRNMNATPQNGCVFLDQTAAYAADSTRFNNTAPTSSVFSLGTALGSNENGASFIAYLWTSIPGFSLFGSYTGNGNADGPFVWCGFKPRWIMIKRVDAAGDNWLVVDTATNTANVVGNILAPNSSAAESSGLFLDIVAGGFKARNLDTRNNASGGTYIFAAFAECPFKFATAC